MGAISFSLDEALVRFLTEQLPLGMFVETGAYMGDSLEVARHFFSKCRSVELSPELCERTGVRFQDAGNITLEQGDSASFLRRHREEFAATPALFWLDAHWCQADHCSGQDSQSPLLEELAAVRSLHAESVLLVDDARLYLSAPPHPHQAADWPDFTAVLQALAALSPSHRLTVLNDVLIFYPSRIAPAMAEFAREHGVDWLIVTHKLKVLEELEQQRRLRRFPFIKYIRSLWQERSRKNHHAACYCPNSDP
jgi:hypothetical protein